MNENNFVMELIAHLNKQLSKSAINNDLKSLNNTMSVRVVAKLSKTLTRKELNNQLKKLNNLEAKIKANIKVDDKAKAQLENNIRSLQKSLSDIEIGLKANPSKINTEADSIRNTIQKRIGKPVSINFDLKKNKLISDIEYLGKRFSKLFSNDSASKKYQNILSKAYSVANDQQLSTARAELQAFTAELKSAGLAGQSTADKWKKLIDRSRELFSAATILRTVFLQVKQAVNTTIELDKVYTDLIKVNDELTRNNYADYLKQCNKKAQELAATQKGLIEGATEFSKSGYDLSTSDALTAKSTVLANVGDMSASDSAKAIISGVQAYDVVDGYTDVVDKAQALIDKYNEIGNTASITTAEIAKGVQTVGSVFADSNTSIDEFIALLSAGNRQFQDADSLSLGLRTSALRIRGCKAELEAMGEETDTVATSTAKLEEQIKGLTNIDGNGGVEILEADKETFRSIYDIYVDIGKVYKEMSDTDQSALLELIAGKNRASAISSTLNNMAEAQEILQNSLNASGSAQKEYDSYLASTEAHLQQFQAKLVETYSTFMNGDMISHVADMGTSILDLVNKTDLLRHSLLGIATINIGKGITSIGAGIATASKQINALGSAIQQVKNLPLDNIARKNALEEIGNATKTLTDKNLKLLLSQEKLDESDQIRILKARGVAEEEIELQLEKLGLIKATTTQSAANVTEAATTNVLSGAMTSLKASITGVGASIRAAFASNPIGMGLMLVSTAVSVASSFISDHNEKVEEARRKAAELTSEYKEQQATLDTNIEKYKQLKAQLDSENLSTDEARSIKEQLLEIQTSLVESYGNEASNIDLVNGKYQEQLDLLGQLSKEKASDYTAQNYSAYKDAKKALEKERTYDLGTLFSFDTRDGMTEAQEQLYEFVKSYSELFHIRSVQDTSTPSTTDFTPKLEVKANVEDAEQIIRQFQKDYEDYIELNGDIDIDTESVKRGISDVLTDIETDDELKEYKEIYDQYLKAEVVKNDTLRPLYQQSIKAVEDYNNALSSNEGIEEAKENLDSIKEAVKNVSDTVEGSQSVFDNIFNQEMTVDTKAATDNVNNNIKDIEPEILDETPIKSFIQAWLELGDTADETLKGAQEELLKLAEAGQLSTDSLREIEGVEEYFENIGLSAQEASNKINELVTSSSQLSSMRTGITSITDALSEKQSDNVVNADTLGKFDVSLQGLESWNEFEETLGNSKSSIEECQQAANKLATEYVNSNNFLSHLTETNKDYYVSQLSNMGVTNALEVVNASLANSENALAVAQSEVIKYSNTLSDSKERNRTASINLANASTSEIQALFSEASAAGVATNGLRQLLAQKYNANNLAVSTAADCANLAQLYSQSISTANALNALAQAKAAVSSGKYIPPEQLKMMTDSAQNSINKANKQTQVAPQVQVAGGGSSGGGGGSSKPKESSKTEIDWIKRKLEQLQKQIDLTKAKFQNLFTVKAKSSNLDKQIKQTTKLLNAESKAADKYKKKASKYAKSSGLSKSLQKAVQEGRLNKYSLGELIKKYGEKTATKIQDYQKYFDNYQDAQKQAESLKTEIRELKKQQLQLYVDEANAQAELIDAANEVSSSYKEQNENLDEKKKYLETSYQKQMEIAALTKDETEQKRLQKELEKELIELEKQKFENIQSYYENQISLIEASEKHLQNQIDLLKTKGMAINAKYYKAQAEYEQGRKTELEKSKKELEEQLFRFEKAGLRGTQNWYDEVTALNEVESEIADCNKTILEMNNNITEVANTIHTKILDGLSSVAQEMDWIANLMSGAEMSDEDTGVFTKEGLATLGTYVSGMNTSKYAANLSKGLLEDMQKTLDNNVLSFTYDGQEWIYNSKEQLEDAIREVNKTYRDEITNSFEYSNKIIDIMIQKLENELSYLQKKISVKQDELKI